MSVCLVDEATIGFLANALSESTGFGTYEVKRANVQKHAEVLAELNLLAYHERYGDAFFTKRMIEDPHLSYVDCCVEEALRIFKVTNGKIERMFSVPGGADRFVPVLRKRSSLLCAEQIRWSTQEWAYQAEEGDPRKTVEICAALNEAALKVAFGSSSFESSSEELGWGKAPDLIRDFEAR